MSYRKQQALEYESVMRRGDAQVRARDEQDFAAPPPLEFPEPRFAEDRKSENESSPADNNSSSDNNSPKVVAQTPAQPVRGARNESWIVKRGHTFTYAGLFLFTFVLYFRPYEMFESLSRFSSMALVMALATFLFYVPSQFMMEGNLTARPREVHLLLLLTVTAIISIPTAINPSEAWTTFNDTFLKAVLMFIVMVNVVRTEWRLKGLIWLSLAVGCLLSLNALENYWAGNFTVEGYRVQGDLGGMFENPNDMALHLVTITPLAVALMFTARNIPIKILYGVCAVLTIAGNVVTFSRGGFLGLAGSMLVMAWKIGRKNRLAVICSSLVVLAAFLAFAPGNYGLRLLSLFDSSLDPVGSSDMRRLLLERSIKVALLNPLTGVGMGNFHIVSLRELVSHNAYTEVGAEMGLIALAFYTLFIVTPLKRLWQIQRETFDRRRGSRFYYLSIGMQASLVAYMISSFFASVAYQWYIYYLVAYAICLRRIYDIEHSATKEASADSVKGQSESIVTKEVSREAVPMAAAVKVEQA